MVDNNYSFLTVIAVALVVAVIASLITASITGNVIKVREKNKGTEIYTKAEIDDKIGKLESYFIYSGLALTNFNPFNFVSYGPSLYTIELVSASDTSATIKVTNTAGVSVTKEIKEGESELINDLVVYAASTDESGTNLSTIIIITPRFR